MVADITLPGVGRQEQPASNPVRQDTNILGLLLVRGVEMEQHPLLLHSHQAFIQPGPLCSGLTRLSGLDKILASDRHLETAVDDLTCRPNNKGHA